VPAALQSDMDTMAPGHALKLQLPREVYMAQLNHTTVGRSVGRGEGRGEGRADGLALGALEGTGEGRLVGARDGRIEGRSVGLAVGLALGRSVVGTREGCTVALADGRAVGSVVGRAEGTKAWVAPFTTIVPAQDPEPATQLSSIVYTPQRGKFEKDSRAPPPQEFACVEAASCEPPEMAAPLKRRMNCWPRLGRDP
jgi:hypothetical protein